MPPEFHDPWRAALAHVLLAAVLIVIVVLPLIGARDAAPAVPSDIGLLDLFAGQIILASFLVAWFCLQQRDGIREFLALPARPWGARVQMGTRLGVLGWASTLAAMALLTALARLVVLPPAEGFTDLVIWLATRPLALRIGLVAAAMWVEEAFFRAFLQRRIGLLGATACFAVSHLNYGSPAMGGGVFVIGLILAFEFRRHRDLAICAIGHGTFDAIQLLVVLPLVAAQLGH